MWTTYPALAKNMLPCAVSDPPRFMTLMENALHVAPVQTIGMECICAGKLVGPSGLLVLLHGKLGLTMGAVEMSLKTKDPRMTDALQRATMEVLQAGA